MSTLPTYFADFLKSIRLQDDLRTDLQEAHRELTERLQADATLKPILVGTFLQGSYRRATIVDPDEADLADVDVVVVTGLAEQAHPEPATAMDLFRPFLDSNYRGRWEAQDRSFGIQQGRVWLDMVITSAPSEATKRLLASEAVQSRLTLDEDLEYRVRPTWLPPERRPSPHTWQRIMAGAGDGLGAWSDDPLRIPDRTRRCWEPTHPLAQIDWTAEKNRLTNGHYLGVVRALKWWRRRNPHPKYPKGYPLEALIGDACPNGITSVAEGVTRTLETMLERWSQHAAFHEVPHVQDHGVEQNVLGRISGTEFAAFHALLGPAARTARRAFEADDKEQSVFLWQNLFGGRFPDARGEGAGAGTAAGGFTPRTEIGTVGGGRFG